MDDERSKGMERTLTVSEADLLAALNELSRDSAGEGSLTTAELAALLFEGEDLSQRTKIEQTRALLRQLRASGELRQVRRATSGLGGTKRELAYQLAR